MSKTLTYRGSLAKGAEERIKLSTKNGLTGYRIVEFKTMNAAPGTNNYETITKIYSKAQGAGSATVDFTDSELLAVSYIEDDSNAAYPQSPQQIIFDTEVVNQDIYVNTESALGTGNTNYMIKLELIKLSEIEATRLTLKGLRQIKAR